MSILVFFPSRKLHETNESCCSHESGRVEFGCLSFQLALSDGVENFLDFLILVKPQPPTTGRLRWCNG